MALSIYVYWIGKQGEKMKAYYHRLRKIYVPDINCALTSNHVKYWIRGIGEKKATKTVMTLQSIPDLPEKYTWAELDNYVKTYGKPCAMEGLPQNSIYWQENQIVYSQAGELLDQFKEIFKFPFCADWMMGCMAVCSLDVIEFDKKMVERGYSMEGGVSLDMYVLDNYGQEAIDLLDKLMVYGVENTKPKNPNQLILNL